MKKYLSLLLILVPLVALNAFADDTPVVAVKGSATFDVIESSITAVISGGIDQIQAQAILWLSSFVMVQLLITNLGLLKSGADIEAVIGKLMGSLLWFGFCFYVISNGADYLNNVGSSFFGIAGSINKTGSFNASTLIDQGVAVGSNLISTIKKVAGITDFGSVIIAGICSMFILIVMAFIASKVFIMKIELALVVMIAPLSFAFLGLNALKDQGIAPFKSLISLMYRIIILAVIISGINTITGKVSASLISVYDNSSWWSRTTGIGNGVWPALLGITTAYLIFGYLAFKSDSIASSLASGGTNLGSADVATAAAIGAAAGAASMTGGASALAGAGKSGQAMGDFMKGLGGGSGASVSNASSSGAGPAPVGAPPAPPSTSLGSGGQSASNKPPERPIPANTATNSKPPTGTAPPSSGGSGTPANTATSEATTGTAPPSSGDSGTPANTATSEAATGTAPPSSDDSGTPPNTATSEAATGTAPSSSDAGTPANTATNSTPASGSTPASSGGSGAPANTATNSKPATGGSTPPLSSGSTAQSAPNKAPVRPTSANTVNSRTPVSSTTLPSSGGSGANAGIGVPSPLEQQVSDLVQSMNQPKDGKSVTDHLSQLNQHVAQEQAATHVSISTHHSD